MYTIGISFSGSWIDFLAAGRYSHIQFVFEDTCQADFLRLNSPNPTSCLVGKALDLVFAFFHDNFL